jgi:hypothetical protein
LDGALAQVLSLQVDDKSSYKHELSEASFTHAGLWMISEQVVFIVHSPLGIMMHLLFGKYVSQASFVVIEVGAFAHVLG